jgi:uncharacterized hydrophobic protein (TIGR00341 family)
MRIIEVIADAGHLDTLKSLAAQLELEDFWHGATDESGRCNMQFLVQPDQRQRVMDSLQGILQASENARIILHTPEAVWSSTRDEDDKSSRSASTLTREELYKKIEEGAHVNGTFILLVILSTIVVAIGLIENNVAVVIGAMVIAPMLGPNLALALSAALGDKKLMGGALFSNFTGFGISFTLCLLLGMFWTGALSSDELLSRTNVGLDGVILALASGLAAALSMTTGLSSVLVGVMVAVALLPPAATAGIMLGAGQFNLAAGAMLLLAVNVVCVNLTAQLIFLFKGVRPRTWLEKKKARQSYTLFILFWLTMLAALVSVIYIKLIVSE